MRRFICIALVMLLTFTLTTGAYASEDSTQWKQYDQAWGNLPLGENGTMKSWGCLITSIAIQMARANTEESSFTPGTLRNRLEASGYISHSHEVESDGNLSYAEAFSHENSPNFYYCGAIDWSATPFEDILVDIEQLQKDGYFVIAQVRFGQHYVACGPASQSDVTIYDPGDNIDSLEAYNGGILGCIYFKSDTTSEQSATQVNSVTPIHTVDIQTVGTSKPLFGGKYAAAVNTFDLIDRDTRAQLTSSNSGCKMLSMTGDGTSGVLTVNYDCRIGNSSVSAGESLYYKISEMKDGGTITFTDADSCVKLTGKIHTYDGRSTFGSIIKIDCLAGDVYFKYSK